MASRVPSNRTATRWTVRIVPVLIVGIFVVAAYAVIGRLCVKYLYQTKGQSGLAAGLIALFLIFFLLTIVCYARVFFAVTLDPGVVPLTNGRNHEDGESAEKQRGFKSRRNIDPEDPPWVPPDMNLDSPGLEAFYSKDVFTCEIDGRPKWCSSCRQWKPDRAHHSSELGRCVKKMDHLCPWVGGMVSEASFNFFTHFVSYTACLCGITLAIAIYTLTQQLDADQIQVDGWVIAAIALSAFFGLFSFGMTLTAGRFIFTNTTNIDMLRSRQTFNLAVLIPRDTPPSNKYMTITYPLQPMPPPLQPPPGGPGATTATVSDQQSMAARDQQATRVFAILKTDPGENPWDLGLLENWKTVMGDNFVEWLLPIRRSPCCSHDSMVSDYPFGPLIDELRKRYEVPDVVGKSANGVEMHTLQNGS